MLESIGVARRFGFGRGRLARFFVCARRKGFDLVVRAFCAIAERQPGRALWLVGPEHELHDGGRVFRSAEEFLARELPDLALRARVAAGDRELPPDVFVCGGRLALGDVLHRGPDARAFTGARWTRRAALAAAADLLSSVSRAMSSPHPRRPHGLSSSSANLTKKDAIERSHVPRRLL